MSSKYFAIAFKSDPTKVNTLCENRGTSSNGTRRFRVVNGQWDGFIRPDGTVHAQKGSTTLPPLGNGVIVWEADEVIPGDYNKVIAWINKKLSEAI